MNLKRKFLANANHFQLAIMNLKNKEFDRIL
jgi:hypothetical protein